MDLNICEVSQNVLHRAPDFENGFQLTKLLTSKEVKNSEGCSKTYTLLLTQKNPEAQVANYRGPEKKP